MTIRGTRFQIGKLEMPVYRRMLELWSDCISEEVRKVSGKNHEMSARLKEKQESVESLIAHTYDSHGGYALQVDEHLVGRPLSQLVDIMLAEQKRLEAVIAADRELPRGQRDVSARCQLPLLEEIIVTILGA